MPVDLTVPNNAKVLVENDNGPPGGPPAVKRGWFGRQEPYQLRAHAGHRFARAKAFLFTLVLILVLGMVAAGITSEGLESLSAFFAQKMYKWPAFSWMALIEGLHRMKWSMPAALGVVYLAMVAWHVVLRQLTLREGNRLDEAVWNVKALTIAWMTGAVAMLVLDAAFFALGISQTLNRTWGSTAESGGVVLLTGLYVFTFFLASLISVGLWEKARRRSS
jgi:hypothetical protein